MTGITGAVVLAAGTTDATVVGAAVATAVDVPVWVLVLADVDVATCTWVAGRTTEGATGTTVGTSGTITDGAAIALGAAEASAPVSPFLSRFLSRLQPPAPSIRTNVDTSR